MSATGIWATELRRPSTGFTLIEILVVMLIIGIMIVGVALSPRVAGNDRDLEKERDRILALADYMRDQAVLQSREYGMRCNTGGYEFVVFDAFTNSWKQVEGDEVTRPRQLPPGISLTLLVEGSKIVLPATEAKVDEDTANQSDAEAIELRPQIMLYSSGELSLFELTLQRKSGAGVRIKPSGTSDRIEATVLEPNPA